MPTATATTTTAMDATKAIQDKVLASVQASQKATVEFVRAWAESVETVVAKLPDLVFTDAPLNPSQVLETGYGFTERLLASQRDFVSKVFEAAAPATRMASATSEAARTTASKA